MRLKGSQPRALPNNSASPVARPQTSHRKQPPSTLPPKPKPTADIGGFTRAHEFANYALAGFVPLAALSSKVSKKKKQSGPRRERRRRRPAVPPTTPTLTRPQNNRARDPPQTKQKQIQGSLTEKVSDWALGLAIPVHMQITTNALVTDYVAARFRPPARGLVLAGSLVAYLGIMKVNLGGPGLSRTIKALWGADVSTTSPSPAAAAAPDAKK